MQEEDGVAAGILGVALFAPHYQAEYVAIHFTPGEGVDEVIPRARHTAIRIPVAHLDCSALVEPIPYEGFAAVIVFSRVLEFNDNVAVLIDLSAVGGCRFPATLPSRLLYADWERYIRSMISVAVQQCYTFIGNSDDPVGVGQELCLFHGALIAVQQIGFVERDRCSHAQLLADRWEWRDPERIPRPQRSSGVCLLTAEDRWFLHIRHYPGCTLIQAAEQCLGASPGSVTLGSARHMPIDDLCLQGEPCRGVVCACNTPPPVSSPPADRWREDHFLFLDFRPVGCRPYGMYQAGGCWFIPSLLARFPFKVPVGYVLGLEGGRQDGEYLFAVSGTTLKARLVFTGSVSAPVRADFPRASPGNEDEGAGDPAAPNRRDAPAALEVNSARVSPNRSRSPRRGPSAGRQAGKLQRVPDTSHTGAMVPTRSGKRASGLTKHQVYARFFMQPFSLDGWCRATSFAADTVFGVPGVSGVLDTDPDLHAVLDPTKGSGPARPWLVSSLNLSRKIPKAAQL